MAEVSTSEREEAISRCVEILGKLWCEVKDDQIECERITSGIVNKTFHVWIRDCKALEIYGNIEDNNVIVRIYNSGLYGKNKLKFNGEVGEVIIHLKLFSAGLAPKILGVFDGGRIEEYIPSRPTTVDELKSTVLSKEVVRKVARFHTLSMPISKKPNYLHRVSSIVKQTVITQNYLEKYPNEVEECKIIMNFPFEEEIAWFQEIQAKVGYKVVFSHNDVNPNNILLNENYKNAIEKITLVDYEMSTYFYRAYDLAYFLRLKRTRFQLQDNKVEFSIEDEDQGSSDALLQEYLNEYAKLSNSDINPDYDNLQRFRMEVEFFDLVYDLFVVGITKIIIAESSIPFPLAFNSKIASAYRQKKQFLITKYGDPVAWQ